MDFSQYETYEFHRESAFNLSTGYTERDYPMHWHSYGEIILVGPGDTNIFQVNQQIYHLVEGDFVLIWPMEMHAIIDADRTEALIIQFSNAFASSLFDFQRIMHFYHDLHVLCIYSHPELVRRLNETAAQMKEIYLSDTNDREIKCCMLLMQFMMELDESREELAPDIERPDKEPQGHSDVTMRKLIEVTDYIKSHLADDDLSQNTMAEMAGISTEHFSRVFKNVTGQTYLKWLNMVRLEKAISLFPEEGMSLTEIAMLSGFQSIPTFNRVFRDAKGISPGEYRNLYTKRKDL